MKTAFTDNKPKYSNGDIVYVEDNGIGKIIIIDDVSCKPYSKKEKESIESRNYSIRCCCGNSGRAKRENANQIIYNSVISESQIKCSGLENINNFFSNKIKDLQSELDSAYERLEKIRDYAE